MEMPARILIIEDNLANLDLMVYLLKAFGYDPVSAKNGLDGLAKTREITPDLIICDVNLPRMDGYGVLANLKTDPKLRKVPVIAVTALAMVGDREKMIAAGFDDHICKPITPETFVNQIEFYLPQERRCGRYLDQANVTSRENSTSEPDQGPLRARGQKEHTAISLNGVNILVVDDTPANLDFARSTLEPFGYKVVSALSVRGAMQLAQRHDIHLVLCDLHMVPESGKDLLALRFPPLAGAPFVIISSTYTSDAERTECLNLGATHFIRRPIEPEALLREVSHLLFSSDGPACRTAAADRS